MATIAEQWLELIDSTEPISRKTVKRMKGAAVDVVQEGSPRCTDIYIFSDGSGLWEKREDDWFIAETTQVAEY
jgi:hypothetical protein